MNPLRLIVDLRHELACWNAGERELAVLRAVPGWQVQLAQSDAERSALLAAGADAVWCWKLDAAEADHCPGLRWVSTPAAGSDYIGLGPLLERGLAVTVSHGHHGPAMAEHAIGLLLALARGLHLAPQRAAAGGWWRSACVAEVMDVLGMRLVIAGYGAIGEHVADRAIALGMRVSGLGRATRRDEDRDVMVHGPAEHDAVLRDAQAVVNLLPHTATTANFLNRARLQGLAQPAIVINLGRGATVDESALTELVLTGRLRAGLDVFSTEPLPVDHPLRHAPWCIITPHTSAVTPDYLLRGARQQAEQMLRFAQGQSLRWQLHPGDGIPQPRVL